MQAARPLLHDGEGRRDLLPPRRTMQASTRCRAALKRTPPALRQRLQSFGRRSVSSACCENSTQNRS
ncbi:hypothetical protein, partial [Burkholderia cenocepacia]|uniref:hypothetical protein n=1 Tax=Burkholderia cenocepacia TaxID=95486 RepID=UPI0019554304